MSFPQISIRLAGLASACLLAGCATTGGRELTAQAAVRPASGSQVAGLVAFANADGGVRVVARLSGLTPGEHGFHVHEVGDCSAPDATSAKGHFNPAGSRHGHVHAEHHAGDMPNLRADAAGNAEYREFVSGLSLSGKDNGVVGRAIVIHADPDDYQSQPAGNSGKRVGCGVIALEAAK